MKNTETLSITMPRELAQALRKQATAEDRKISAVIKIAVKAYLSSKK